MMDHQQDIRLQKSNVVLRAHLYYQRLRQLFALPGCYRKVRAFNDCEKSRLGLALDLFTLFFSYKTFPDHYGLCRLWEIDKKEWSYYYGSNYHPHQRLRLQKAVQPFEYRVLFNDKYLCALICRALGIRTPYTWGTIEPGQDYRRQIQLWLQASPARPLIIKPLFGSAGRDIVMVKKIDNCIVVSSAKVSIPLDDFFLAETSIVQDVLVQDARMAAFSPFSVNTLRIITMLTKQDDLIIVNGSMRSGVGESFVDNWSAGGVSVGVDFDRGRLKKYAYDRKWNRFGTHPTSGVVFEDYPIPEWERVHATAAAIQKAFPFYRMLGLDMAIGQGGEPVLIEINGAPDLAALEQKAGPLLKSERVLRAFGEYDLLVNKHQRKLYASLGKQ
jgi:hypothetical protein